MFVTTPKALLLGALMVLGLAAQTGTADAAQKKAYFAGGCFWCVESDFESLAGVSEVVSGYTGGKTKNPTYKQVTKGGTGHYEAVEIRYNDSQVTYDQLLFNFFRSVDPTDAGGQFCDRGNSYRTAVFVTNAQERAAAEAAKARAQKDLGRKIVTPILNAGRFYKAEAYHQDYYKSGEIVLTRRGPKSKANAYKFYRKACKRDQKIRQLWGSAAPFAS
ncbi:MAG: peptide-methionine (S)-S-oxide reductase MsrA [Silicimonas sp.]|nr:peptide-methionine (S)-S-oxide reductase MsrA [Boseongicola sp.]NNE78806.1 peptide-methionine (S)-S-oxide reductase MsrA [Silicimonas sp.]